ncbi:magnesium transporter [Corynebacterium qintianiae]|uniref:Magnesium transporter MgtE n=1 Tax=Corynebacterium qintianiae TaxID=2709392 RepID=A0A7T0KMS7_9CORY|nr:magnesium transporter [Corynebacterium qintianiae]QPK83354.1 magnesium transporter [Corynebacterium qintianiae]
MKTAHPAAARDLERRLGGRREAKAEELEEIQAQLAELSFRDLKGLVVRASPSRGAKILRLLPPERSAALFDALGAAHQADIIRALGDDKVVNYFGALGAEDRVALLDHLPAEIADRLIRELDEDDQKVTGVVLGYKKGTVGRRMSPRVPVVTPVMTVDEVVEQLRDGVDTLETIYTVPVVDEDRIVCGVLRMRSLFRAAGTDKVSELMESPSVFRADDNLEDSARWLLSSGRLAVPVVDDDFRLLGIFTFDEANDVVEGANSEDSARMGGSEALRKPYLSTPVIRLVRSRIVWLLVLAFSAILTVQVLDVFEATLEKAVVLSLFIPLLTGTGGNTGNQAATTVTRALALNDVRKSDILKVMWRELRVGLMLGSVLGGLGFAIATLVFDLNIGTVIGATLFLICTFSATVGGMMPIIAKAVGADPAVFSNPFISTFCDATGLVIYFLMAKTVLGI